MVNSEISYGDLTLDVLTGTLKGPEKSVRVSGMASRILVALMSAGGELVITPELMDKVWLGKPRTRNAVFRQIHGVRRFINAVNSQVVIISEYSKGIRLARM